MWAEAGNGPHPDTLLCGVRLGGERQGVRVLAWETGCHEFLRGTLSLIFFIAGGRFAKMLPRTDEKTSSKN